MGTLEMISMLFISSIMDERLLRPNELKPILFGSVIQMVISVVHGKTTFDTRMLYQSTIKLALITDKCS